MEVDFFKEKCNIITYLTITEGEYTKGSLIKMKT